MPITRSTITGLSIQVEITGYNELGQVAGRPDKPVVFVVLEADIPEAVLEWVRTKIDLKGGG